MKNSTARAFYATEALRGGWSARQLDRQIASQFYERTALSKNTAAMLARGSEPRPGDEVDANDEVRDPAENPPVGLILCSEKNDALALARYALEGLPSKVLAREYRLALPDERRLAAEIEKTRQRFKARGLSTGPRTTAWRSRLR